MDFAFTTDQEELRSAARRMLAERYPAQRLHEVADSGPGWDADVWPRLVDLGWVGLSAPDGGGSFLDEAVLLEEAGAALLPAPLLSGVVALPALVAGSADPTRRTALAWAEPAGPLAFASPDRVATAATAGGSGGWALTGSKDDVADLGAAEQVVVVARTDDGPALFLVRLPAAGATVTMRSTTDRTRRIGTLGLDGTPAAALAIGEPARAVLDAVALRATVALALESVGVAQRVFELAAEHAKTREQFGRVIGTYQAVSHRVADAYVRLELARSLAYRAAWAVETRESDADEVSAREATLAAAQAKAAAADAAVFGAEAAIQVLGGTGFTWEHVAQRYYKRALGNQSWAGSSASLRALVAADLLA